MERYLKNRSIILIGDCITKIEHVIDEYDDKVKLSDEVVDALIHCKVTCHNFIKDNVKELK